MPPDMAVSMRHTKIKAEEAALLAGELKKPNWESRNEGIHERVSFEDTIWGFDLAGGSYYKTPLRVTYVKKDSRAEKAGIRPGDRLKRINDIETSTLTIQEAHDIIVESGIHLKLAVTAPEDEEDAYFCYEDPIITERATLSVEPFVQEDGYDSEEERRREEERARKRQVHAKVSSYWSLQWPWVSKRRVIYRESNCFMVPSKFEEKNRDKFPVQAFHRIAEDLALDNLSNLKLKPENDGKTEFHKMQDRLNTTPVSLNNGLIENMNGNSDIADVNGQVDEEKAPKEMNGHLGGIIEEKDMGPDEIQKEKERNQDISSDNIVESNSVPIVDLPDEQVLVNGDAKPHNDDDLIQELLNGHDESESVSEEEKVIDSILSEDDSQTNEVANGG